MSFVDHAVSCAKQRCLTCSALLSPPQVSLTPGSRSELGSMCGLLAEVALVRLSSPRAQQPTRVALACELADVRAALAHNPALRPLVAADVAQ